MSGRRVGGSQSTPATSAAARSSFTETRWAARALAFATGGFFLITLVIGHTLARPQGAMKADRASAKQLLVPVSGVNREALNDSWGDARSGGRSHAGIDIPAPRGTPVVAVEAGRVVTLSESARGGISLYLADAETRWCYFYAHLDGYAPRIVEGSSLARGQVLAYVGSTGNAPDEAPHLHFEVARFEKRATGCLGEAINPFALLATP